MTTSFKPVMAPKEGSSVQTTIFKEPLKTIPVLENGGVCMSKFIEIES